MTTSSGHEAALLERVRSEAPQRSIERFDLQAGRALGAVAASIAEREGLAVSIAIMKGTQRAFHASFEGTTAEHDDWLRRKVNTATRHELPSLEIAMRHKVSGRVPDWLDPHEFALAGGAVPLFIGANLVAVAVASGLVDSPEADHDFVMRAIRTWRERS